MMTRAIVTLGVVGVVACTPWPAEASMPATRLAHLERNVYAPAPVSAPAHGASTPPWLRPLPAFVLASREGDPFRGFRSPYYGCGESREPRCQPRIRWHQ
jgi:hypothetical protein